MIEDLVKPYYKAIQEEKEKLIGNVNQQINAITIPEKTNEKPTEASVKTSPIPAYCLGAGILILAAGLIIGKTVLTVGGGLIAVGGGTSLLYNKRRALPEPEPDSVDYQSISNSIFQILKKLNKQISDEWYECTGKQKDLLKNNIANLNIEADKRQKMLERSLKRSVIDISMTQILSELNTLANHKNVAEYRQYLATLKTRFTSAVEKALEEQTTIYKSVENASI